MVVVVAATFFFPPRLLWLLPLLFIHILLFGHPFGGGGECNTNEIHSHKKQTKTIAFAVPMHSCIYIYIYMYIAIYGVKKDKTTHSVFRSICKHIYFQKTALCHDDDKSILMRITQRGPIETKKTTYTRTKQFLQQQQQK